ncbi:hypothetical protein SAMN05216228_10249 [Rhizobium tibeticum]|uniref:Uncharacterized protein n=1 Tax=Rhizobium tibeticum TaxID=501024 RepID=A0A1H8SAR2_9HYPH|nr:hypothetical protein RTCCBAU85039_4746 [Rhizobium tibeticum]SEO75606.1 hypothetical protein SAMN05216228_10249 [Rhizobium tibeticum]
MPPNEVKRQLRISNMQRRTTFTLPQIVNMRDCETIVHSCEPSILTATLDNRPLWADIVDLGGGCWLGSSWFTLVTASRGERNHGRHVQSATKSTISAKCCRCAEALLCYLAPNHLWTNRHPIRADATYVGESGLIQTSLILRPLRPEARLFRFGKGIPAPSIYYKRRPPVRTG